MRKFYKIDPRLSIDKLDDILDDPIVIRVNEFDEEALEDFEEDLDKAHATGQPVIPIVIDSYGGTAYGLLGMVAAIEGSRVPVATIGSSKMMSAGALLFMWGTEGYRFMHPETTMMIHDIGSLSMGKIEEIKADTAHIDLMNKSVYKRASRRIGKDVNYLANLIKQHNHVDWFLTAKEARSHNITNHLRVPCFEIEIALKLTFG